MKGSADTPGTIHLGQIAGIRIELDNGWLLLVSLLTGSLATGRFQRRCLVCP